MPDEAAKALEDAAWFEYITEAFIKRCDQHGPSREMSIAKTKVEEACMWAVKFVSK